MPAPSHNTRVVRPGDEHDRFDPMPVEDPVGTQRSCDSDDSSRRNPPDQLGQPAVDATPTTFPDIAAPSPERVVGDPDSDNFTFATSANLYDDLLLVHFRDVVCNYMMPVIEPRQNPWLQIYLPLATTGMRTPCKTALGHGIRAVAAYHLAHTHLLFKTQYLEQAAHHRAKAQECVCQALSQNPKDLTVTDKCALLAASLTLISTDVYGNEHDNCDVHLDLAKRVFESTGDETFWKSTPDSRTLLQLLRCYDLVGATTGGYGLFSGSFSDTFGLVGEDRHFGSDRAQTDSTASDQGDIDGPYTLDLSFGVGRQTFSLLKETVRMDAICAEYGDSQHLPNDILDGIRSLWERMSLLDPDADVTTASYTLPLNTSDLTSAEAAAGGFQVSAQLHNAILPPVVREEIVGYHKTAFHYALILYFHRILHRFQRFAAQPGALRPDGLSVPVSISNINCQEYVEKVLECLESIDCLVRNTHVEPGNTLWPAFIAAAESMDVRLRQRALIWLARAARRGLGNVARSKEIVMETWRRVDRLADASGDGHATRGLGAVDWRVVMREKGSKIMLA